MILDDIQKAEQMSSQILSPLPGLREGGGGWVPICRFKIMRISTKSLCGRAITCMHPQEGQNSEKQLTDRAICDIIYKKKGGRDNDTDA